MISLVIDDDKKPVYKIEIDNDLMLTRAERLDNHQQNPVVDFLNQCKEKQNEQSSSGLSFKLPSPFTKQPSGNMKWKIDLSPSDIADFANSLSQLEKNRGLSSSLPVMIH